MALIVGRAADIHLDNANILIFEVFCKPYWFHQYIRDRRAVSPERNAVCQFNLLPFTMRVRYVSYEEEAILTTMVAEMSGNTIVKSTEILREHYVDFAREKMDVYVELRVRPEGMDYWSFFISPFSVAQTAICVLAL